MVKMVRKRERELELGILEDLEEKKSSWGGSLKRKFSLRFGIYTYVQGGSQERERLKM
jgi:hypothetical protein